MATYKSEDLHFTELGKRNYNQCVCPFSRKVIAKKVTTQDETIVPLQGMAELLRDHEPSKPLQRGDIVEGEVMSVDQDGVLVNVGLKNEGVIPPREMRSMPPDKLDQLQPGSTVLVYVIHTDAEEGQALLSMDRAQGEEIWRKLEKVVETGETINGIIQGINKGGAVVDVEGVQGFIPLSQLAQTGRAADEEAQANLLSQRIGEKVDLKLLELNRRRNRVILSERQAVQQVREEQKIKLMENLQEGETRRGKVSGIANFGAFVDLGGADGLIHVSEISWEPVQSAEEMLKIGDELDVYVLKVDRETKRIALSLRQLQPTPWDTISERYHVGQQVTGTVTRLTNFGAFARIEGSVEGLIHISELSDKEIHHPKEVVNEGDTMTLTILRIEPERRRLALSMRQAEGLEPAWDQKFETVNNTIAPEDLLMENQDGQ